MFLLNVLPMEQDEQANDLDFPELSIDKAISAIELFENKLKGKTDSKEAFAQLLGYSSVNNGAFLHKLADLRKYGLITTRGTIELTDLAKKIIWYVSQEERNQAILQAIRNIGIVAILIDAIGNKEPTDEDLPVQLKHAGMDNKKIVKNKSKIKKVYISFLPYIGKETLPKRSVQSMNPAKTDIKTNISTIPQDVDEQKYFKLDSEGVLVLMPKEIDNIELIRFHLDRWEKKLKEKESKEAN